MTNALIVVDVQNDFISGSLAVGGGETVALALKDYLTSSLGYDYIVATQDWHIDPGEHFSETPDYIDTWPSHCVARSWGAALRLPLSGIVNEIFRKGAYEAAYSGFEGIALGKTESLVTWLRAREVDDVYVCGIATDYCVKATVLDALKYGFATTLLTDLTVAVSPAGGEAALQEMRAAGVAVR